MATNTLCRTLRFFNYKRDISTHLNLLHRIIPQCTNLKTRMCCSDRLSIDEPPTVKKKKKIIPRISLLSEQDDMDVVTLEEAQKIADRRNLKLVKIIDLDIKSERPVYKLMSIHEYLQSQAKSKIDTRAAKEKMLKVEKTMHIKTKISENDLQIKVKSVHKMLGKKHPVRIAIAVDDNKSKANEIAEYILSQSKDIAKSSIQKSGNFINVMLIPILNADNKSVTENEDLNDEKTE